MTVAMDQIPRRLTWEAFVELPEELHAPDRVPGSGYWKLAPNLAVEILSASTRRKDLLRKPTHYFSVGVEELWLVDCGERVFHVLHPNGDYHEWVDGDVALSPLLPDFEVAVTDLISQVS